MRANAYFTLYRMFNNIYVRTEPTSPENAFIRIEYNLMSKFNFDDTETSGIWWSTNVSIRDLCVELKADTSCGDSEIVELLRSIAKSIEANGI